MGVLDRLLTIPTGTEAFRAYVGYSGWGPGQLEQEMKTGAWIILPADPTIVFEKDPSLIWPDILRSFGRPYECYADMPPDPSVN